MSDMPMLFPVEPAEFWRQMRTLVEEIVTSKMSQSLPPVSGTGMKEKPLLKMKDLCQIFEVSKPTLYEWMADGRLRSFTIRNRRYFTREDVLALMQGKPFPPSQFFPSKSQD